MHAIKEIEIDGPIGKKIMRSVDSLLHVGMGQPYSGGERGTCGVHLEGIYGKPFLLSSSKRTLLTLAS